MSEESLFLAALAKENPAEREAFLNEACGTDRALRARVQLLLEADARACGVLDQPAVAGPEATRIYSRGHEVGEIIASRYKLLEAIGEGGMGTVWVAEQTEPVRRKVALKLIKAGMDSRSVLARFEVERQALAVMDHPNIAKVLDGGLTDAGRPFFVMEYVKGVPITEYCDTARLNIAERLSLFTQVCQAVQHAHQKGIIHRDLKPSNILVAPYDDRPVPKVIDFGLAKAMHQSLTERTLHTAHEMVLGTPLYMSPEQAQLNNLDVDTRSDIYSLGVLLYELLTGTTPLEKQRFKQAAWDEVKRIIREEEPQRPSLRLSSADTLPSLAAGRQIDPLRLTKMVRGELDWIVMKSLEKDRTRRYETANGFAMDIQRYLSGEPAMAAPPSTRYRLQKFARKYRGPLTTAASIVALLVAGAAFTSWQAVRATRAETATRLAAKEAADKAAETTTVLDFVENKIIAAARPDGLEGGLGRKVTVREALDKALPFVELNFRDQPLIEARLRTTLGQSYRYLGDRKIALEQFERANVINQKYRPEAYETLLGMSLICEVYQHLGRGEEGLKLSEETVARMQAKLGPDHRDTLRANRTLAKQHHTLRHYEDARRLLSEILKRQTALFGRDDEDTLVTLMDLGTELDLLRRFEEALQTRQEALTRLNAKFGEGHPLTLNAMGGVGFANFNVGRRDEALKLREKCLAFLREKLPPDHPWTVAGMRNLARSYEADNRQADALKLREEALALEQANLGKDDASPLRHAAALAENYAAVKQHVKAVGLAEETVEILKAKLGPDDPSTLRSMGNLASIYRRAGRLSDAQMLSASVAQMRKMKLGPDHPDTLAAMADLAAIYKFSGRLELAVPLREEVLSRRTALLGRDHSDTLTSIHELGHAYLRAGKTDLALPLYDELIKLRIAKLGLQHPDTINAIASAEQVFHEVSDYRRATAMYEKVWTLRKKELPEGHKLLIDAQNHIGLSLLLGGHLSEAEPHLLASFEDAVKASDFPKEWRLVYVVRLMGLYAEWDKPDEVAKWQAELQKFGAGAESHLSSTGGKMFGASRFRGAERLLRDCLSVQEQLRPDDWQTFETKSLLGGSLLRQKNYAEAEPLMLTGYEGLKAHSANIPLDSQTRLTDAVNRLIQLYKAIGDNDKAERWQNEFEAQQKKLEKVDQEKVAK